MTEDPEYEELLEEARHVIEHAGDQIDPQSQCLDFIHRNADMRLRRLAQKHGYAKRARGVLMHVLDGSDLDRKGIKAVPGTIRVTFSTKRTHVATLLPIATEQTPVPGPRFLLGFPGFSEPEGSPS
jgi:hypothetical protein